jgi:hypothetical protein
VSGDPSFTVDKGTFESCVTEPPAVAFVHFTAPVMAEPGDSFDAVVTISAEGDAFPSGTVNVHGEIVRPTVTLDPRVVEFGDVPFGTHPSATVVFRNMTTVTLLIIPPPDAPPFVFDRGAVGVLPGSIASRIVSVGAISEGNHAADAIWSLMPRPDLDLPPSCAGTASVSLHALVLAPADGGTDAADAPTEAGADSD